MLLGLSAEQSKKLLQFLCNLTTSNKQKSSDQEVNIANMAGIDPSLVSTIYNYNAIYCTCKLGSYTWIIDSGTSYHMSFNAKTLYDLQSLENPNTNVFTKWTQGSGHTLWEAEVNQLDRAASCSSCS